MHPVELPPVLYHYTCNHRLNGVIADRALRPYRHPLLGAALVWLTDLDIPDRRVLGLTSQHLRCDRTENRVDVQTTAAMQPWVVWARHAHLPPRVRDALERGGALPLHWWVSPADVAVLTFHRARGHIGKVFA